MTAGETGNMWAIFVEDGRLHARRLRDGFAERARVAQDSGSLGRGALDDLALDAYTIATLSKIMGVEDIGQLAQACERAFRHLASYSSTHNAELQIALTQATRELVLAFDVLAHPDASGARTDARPLDHARAKLELAMGGQPGPDTARPIIRSDASKEAHAEPTGEEQDVWTPTVDDDMVDMFVDEANERLDGLSQKLLELEARPAELDLVRDIFRDLHTVKGSSGMVGLKPMNRLAHAAEDLVGQIREGSRQADKLLIDALLAAVDALRAILGLAIKRSPITLDLTPLMARLRNPAAAAISSESEIEAIDPQAGAGASVQPAEPSAASGKRPVAEAQKQTLRVDFDKLDLLLNLVGELVLSKAGLTVGIQGLASLGRELEHDRRLARRVSASAIAAGFGAAPGTGSANSNSKGTNGDPQRGQSNPSNSSLASGKSLRHLSDELGRVERVFQEIAQDLDASSLQLDRVSAELRDQVMKLRMVPIAGVFRKYHRTVRDLAHSLNKKIRLELVGEETELDKVLVEQLDDPLMHLVRNAVDHGIETPETRLGAGKDPEGTLKISAYHRGNQIALEISDDGGGIDPARLRSKALEKKIATAEELEAMDDREVLDVIFRPGFSTAAKVSEVSGRGVGMDVVRDAIVSRLKGTVEVSSVVGTGTVFTLRLPLTLAIIQVLLARAGGEVFAIPLDVVSRTLTCTQGDIRVVYDREVLPVRELPRERSVGAAASTGQARTTERQVPLVRLRDALELDVLEGEGEHIDNLHVILVSVFGSTYGLVCDRLIGKQEIVIKSLGSLLEEVPCAAGATLLGERCAVILDVPAVIARAIQAGRPAVTALTSGGGGGASSGTSPHALPHPEAPAHPASPLPTAGSRQLPRILLVEDSEVIRTALKRLLEGAGYNVVTANDGVQGLRLAETEPFDLISTDVMMPNMDGYELTRALRASERHRDTPIIMVTSRGEKIDRVRGFDAGVDEYITKPHDRQDLLRAVAKHVRKRGGGR